MGDAWYDYMVPAVLQVGTGSLVIVSLQVEKHGILLAVLSRLVEVDSFGSLSLRTAWHGMPVACHRV